MQVNTTQFSFRTGTFTAFASDFGPLRDGHILTKMTPLGHTQLHYGDGIHLKSMKSGTVVRYYLARTEKDREGDVQFWAFRPITEDVRTVPTAADTRIIIYND